MKNEPAKTDYLFIEKTGNQLRARFRYAFTYVDIIDSPQIVLGEFSPDMPRTWIAIALEIKDLQEKFKMPVRFSCTVQGYKHLIEKHLAPRETLDNIENKQLNSIAITSS